MASATPVTSIYSLYNRPNVGIGGTSPQLNNLFVNYVSGNIGIGTTSVVTNLYLNYAAAPTLNDGSSVTNTYAFVSEAGAGNVGIGTTDPGELLHLYDASANDDMLILESGGDEAGIKFVGAASDDWKIYHSWGSLFFNSIDNGVVPLFLQYGGNVGIGTTDPDGLLHLSISSGDPAVVFDIGNTNKFTLGVDDSMADVFKNQ